MPFPLNRAAALLLGLILLSACGSEATAPTGAQSAAAAEAAPASLAVTLERARLQPIQRSVIAAGPVTAWEEMQLGVELSGLRVTAVHVDVGQQVRRGDRLLDIDHRTLDSELRQAQAAYAEARAGVELAKVNLRRGQALASSQLISASALDELRAGQVQAEARLGTLSAQRDGVQLRRDFATLRAPDAGIISKRLVQPGQVVSAGAELLRLIRQGRLEWRPELPEAELARVATGAAVLLRDPNGAPIRGQVRAISPGVDSSSRTGTVYADLPEPGALKAGSFIEGRLVTGVSDALMVPAAAVVMRDGYAYVFTVDEQNLVHRVRVRIGTRSGGRIELLDGITAGQLVVATGAGFLGDGDKVRVVAGAPPGPAAAAETGALR